MIILSTCVFDCQKHILRLMDKKTVTRKQSQFYANFFLLIWTCGICFQLCPWDPDLRELRADCYLAQGDLFKAAGDIRPTTKLRNDNTAGYFKLSNLHYQMGEADESLRWVYKAFS